MKRRFLQLGLVFLAVVVLATVAYPWFKDSQRKLHDQDRVSGCMANMGYVRQQLKEHAGQFPPDTPIDAAIDKLIQSSQIDPTRLTCQCSGRRFRFRGRVGWLQGYTREYGREIIAFEPPSSHHPSVSLLVVYARCELGSIQQDELRARLDRPASEEKGKDPD